MLQQFLKDVRLHRRDYFTHLLILAGAFLFGLFLAWLIMSTDEDPGSWFCLGTLMSSIILVLIDLFGGVFGYPQEFMLALSMGRTRKGFMLSYYLQMVMQLVVGWVLLLLLHQVELLLCTQAYPQYQNEIYFSFLTDWRVLVPVFLLLPVFSMFLGSLYGRFGKKGLLVFYFVWLFCCIVVPRMFHDEPSEAVLDRVALGMMGVIQAVPVDFWIGFGAVTAVVMASATIKFGMEQMVK